jgi:hypothetical protein
MLLLHITSIDALCQQHVMITKVFEFLAFTLQIYFQKQITIIVYASVLCGICSWPNYTVYAAKIMSMKLSEV